MISDQSKTKAELIWELQTLRKHAGAENNTEHKLAEEALQLTQFSVDNSTDAVYWMGPDAKLIYVNNAAIEALGYSKSELLTMTVHDIDPEFPAEIWPAHWAELKEKKSFIIHTIHRRKDESIFPVEITVNFIRFGGREINCAIAHDITERKQTEEALKLSEIRYRQMFETSRAIMLIIDPSDGRIIDANEAAHRFYGYDTQTLTSMRIMDINTLPDEEIRQEMERAKMEERNFFNFHHRLASGNIHEVEVYSSPVQIEGKTVLYSIIHDVTGRVNLEKINSVMFRIAKAASTTQTLPELVNSIKTYLNEVIDTTNFYIGLYDESTDTISEPYSADEYDSFTTFPAEKTLTAYVIKTGKPLFADEKTYDKLHQAGQVDIIGTPSELWLGVPLKVKDIVIGALAVQSYTDANLYTEKDLELLAHVSHEIATAIERKQSEEELYKKTTIQEKLLETANQLSASLDLTEVLDRIAHQAHGLLGAYGCVLYELDQAGKTLSPMIAIEPENVEETLSIKLDIDSCLTGIAIKAKQSKIFNQANKHPTAYQIPGTVPKKLISILASNWYNMNKQLVYSNWGRWF